MTREEAFTSDLKRLINSHSRENHSNTPDGILAQYIDACLAAFETATRQRETWYGRDGSPTTAIDAGEADPYPRDTAGPVHDIAEARRRIQAAFDADPGFRYGYVANIAMLLHDAFVRRPEVYGEHNPFIDDAARTNLAEAIVDLVFKG